MKSKNYKREDEGEAFHQDFAILHSGLHEFDSASLISSQTKLLFSGHPDDQLSSINCLLAFVQHHDISISTDAFHRLLDLCLPSSAPSSVPSLRLVQFLLSYESEMLDSRLGARIAETCRLLFPSESSLLVLINFSLYGTWTQRLVCECGLLSSLVDFSRTCSPVLLRHVAHLCNNLLVPLSTLNAHIHQFSRCFTDLFDVIRARLGDFFDTRTEGIAFTFFESFVTADDTFLLIFIESDILRSLISSESSSSSANSAIRIAQEVLDRSPLGAEYLSSVRFVDWLTPHASASSTAERAHMFLAHMCFSHAGAADSFISASFHTIAASWVRSGDSRFRVRSAAFELLIELTLRASDLCLQHLVESGCFDLLFESFDLVCDQERVFLIRAISRIISMATVESASATLTKMRCDRNFLEWLSCCKFSEDLEVSSLSRYVMESLFYGLSDIHPE